jgi:hypothetical protein
MALYAHVQQNSGGYADFDWFEYGQTIKNMQPL